jgi:hypothetical protein
MARGPTGVWAIKESIESWPPSGFNCETIQSRKCWIPSDPAGRSPNETARRVSASAAVPRKAELLCCIGRPGEAARHVVALNGLNKPASKAINCVSCFKAESDLGRLDLRMSLWFG